ncbi:hypothetical protein D9619_002040 [Psilocybe cf. subviscida]|uniref:Uncharacterized protein n=1 Tax=Psilocybe cf. subviscida TaxID=2480587 RepID=A0A8H5BDF3_9AGAR|nr:hypothetical protein D9619_002040 [Psilocybe cf. subviscida]
MSSTRPQKRTLSGNPSPVVPTTKNIENALKAACSRNMEKEYEMKDLESKLSEDLNNFRTIDGLLKEVHAGLERHHQRAERSIKRQIPDMQGELEDSMDTLTDLAETLPTTQAQVSDIEKIYDSGRSKADSLIADLAWLNTEFYERWRTIIFTPSSPVSWRWKVYLRTLFVVSFIICSWLFWIAVKGAYRAHRHRLVWGEKLMS